MPSKNNPGTSEYFNVNFIMIALFITQSAHRKYSSVNDIYDICSLTSIMSCRWFKHGFVTSWENVLFMLENIGTCVKNYLELFPLHRSTQGKSFHRLCARFVAVILVDFYINNFILHRFTFNVFIKDSKGVNYKGSEIIDSFEIRKRLVGIIFLLWMRDYPK